MKSCLFSATAVFDILFLVQGLAACQSGIESEPSKTFSAVGSVESQIWSEVSTFKGTIPCASCPGIEMTLQLKPDGTFFLNSVYLDAENSEDRELSDMGRWALTVGDDMLILRGGAEGARRWSVLGLDTLRMLNNLGGPIASDFPYELYRIDEAQHLSGSLPMSGMYRYMADAALFYECRTRKRYPTVFEEAHIDLERAYLKASHDPGEPLKAAFEGRIEMRPKMEGGGEREFVIVNSFGEVFPGESCFDGESPLEGTIWRLIELAGLPVESVNGTSTPRLEFISEDSRVAGSGGCNRFGGGYEISGDSLCFGQMASTTMACQEGMDNEAAFLQALGATTHFDLYGNILELWSARRFIARLEGFAPEKVTR